MRRMIVSTAIAAIAWMSAPDAARAYDIDCKIILCLPAGFPAGCGDAYRTFIDRITARPPKPPIGHCPFGSASDAKVPAGRPAIEHMRRDLLASAEDTLALLDETMIRMIERGTDETLIEEIRAQRDDAVPQAHRMAETMESVRCTHYWRFASYRIGGGEDRKDVPGTQIVAINGDGSGFSMQIVKGRFEGSQCTFKDIDGVTRIVGDATMQHVVEYDCHTWGRDDTRSCKYRTFWGPIPGIEFIDINDDGET